MADSKDKVYTVTALTRLLKYTLEESFPSVWVEGEISNYIHHSSGHRYLTLKDENAAIKLTIWRSVGKNLKFEPENGMKVIAYGNISVYEKQGNYQLNVRKLTPVGVGDLEVAFRQLHEKLSKEGLFDHSRKKALPAYPRKVGIVTSPTGAAIRDIIQIARRRNRTIEILIYPARVQGKGAAETIAAGIEYFNTRGDIDVIITGRGGGSLEDLWNFNEELVVRSIADSKIPVVSGVGHEIDTTLADLAADLRAPTPSAAAELVFWPREEFLDNLTAFRREIERGLRLAFEDRRESLRNLIQRPVFRRPEELLSERIQRFDNTLRLMDNAGKNILEKSRNGLSLVLSRLEALSPLAVMKRGFAVVKHPEDGEMIVGIKSLKTGDKVEIGFSDGKAGAEIMEIYKQKKE